MPKPLSILYRGFLSSCNYGCTYCPFAKHTESVLEHQRDAVALEKFVQWLEARVSPISVFFTPWGEALIRTRYQKAVQRLTNTAHLEKVVVQTNGSWGLTWLEAVNLEKLALWITFHPSETSLEKFVARVHRLFELGVRFSVGVVGIRENLDLIEALRHAIPPEIYLWINAFDRRGKNYYSPEMLKRFVEIDPHFALNLERYKSRGQACSAGHTVVSVDGFGTARRCHFIETPIGSIYEPDFETKLEPKACSRSLCDCHIGYVHLEKLGLDKVFAGGILERIPSNWDYFSAPGSSIPERQSIAN
jgi:MoaA/NifB/PqqE/SkfB family radical SAM enzyme